MKKLSLKNVGDQNLHLRASSSQRAPFFVFFIFLHPKTNIPNTTKSPQQYLGTKKPQNLGTVKIPKIVKSPNREINYPSRHENTVTQKSWKPKSTPQSEFFSTHPFFCIFSYSYICWKTKRRF